ncbi:MAG: MMPL family transporter, partial [Pseudomonadota bacterium]
MTRNFFMAVTARPRLILLLSGLFVAWAATGLTTLVKDTSVRAFIPTDHPSVLTEALIDDVFGLTDPIAIAVVSEDGSSIFTAERLALIRTISERLGSVGNLRHERITSLATESAILGTPEAVLVEPYIPEGLLTAEVVAASQARWQAMPPHKGTLVANDESGAVILAEVEDLTQAAATYEEIQTLIADLESPEVTLHVAGPAAVSAYLSKRIDGDARLMQPLVFILVLGFIYLAFRRAGALLGPLVVLLGAAGGAMGIMAWNGVPYFAITNALPVILVAIAVADGIHILSYYYRLKAEHPNEACRELVIQSMLEMARPITLTTLTTMAGFLGIALASIMPPITYFAWYAALGVALAWLFSLVTLPAALVLLNLGPSPAFRSWAEGQPNRLGAFFTALSQQAASHYRLVLAGFFGLVLLAGYQAMELRVDRSQVENFAPGEPIRLADELINERFAGTSFLDIVVEAEDPEGFLDESQMARVATLQRHFEALPHVETAVGIADYLSLLHQAVNETSPIRDDLILPEEADSIAQYLLVYEASGDPTDFEEEIDGNYETLLVRGVLDSVHFSQTRETVEALQRYLEQEFNGDGLRAELGGDVNITYHWMSRLEASHFQGVGLSLVMVLGMAIFVFRSLGAGFISVVPVSFTILMIYALMASFDVYLEPATSMFAAISVGVGVDFAIHLVDRLRIALRLNDNNLRAALDVAMPGTARACFFNATALGVGFSVMLFSELPMLQRFGGLVASAALASFVVGLIVIPAAYAAAQAIQKRASGWATGSNRRARHAGLGLPLLLALCLVPEAEAETNRSSAEEGLRIARLVAERPEGVTVRRTIEMTLTNRRGAVKTREAWVLKTSDDK